ncbi:MAG: hypothetical protein LUH01_10530 [Parabacteroides gordonii]|nr:hypothetical protein [Parabacteroides gordonii]
MDINFHYYAVKTLAIRAGFLEEQGQIIANYSQFVDDFTSYMPMFLNEVPEFARHLCTKLPYGWFFSPVTTGFESWFDMARLITEQNQRTITIPFHFIPPHTKLNETKKGDERIAWRVVPAHLDTDSMIRDLLLTAKDKYLAKPNARENLIRIGLLLHIFADTYAHQNFSGFWGWENYCLLTSVSDNKNDKSVTDAYSPAIYHQMLGIGHTEANHAPDDSNVSFEMKMQFKENGKDEFLYGRSNTSEFCIASREIIDYLSSCLDRSPIPESEWEKLSPLLGNGFLTSFKNPALLNEHWKALFPDIQYHYNKDGMMNELLIRQSGTNEFFAKNGSLIRQLSNQGIEVESAIFQTKSDDFFHYNVIADEVRNFVNGVNVGHEQLMKLKNALRMKEDDTDLDK